MMRESLIQALRGALRECPTADTPVRKEGVTVNENTQQRTLTIEVSPLKHSKERFYLVLFEEESVQHVHLLQESPKREITSLSCSVNSPRHERRLKRFKSNTKSPMSPCRLSTRRSSAATRSCKVSMRSSKRWVREDGCGENGDVSWICPIWLRRLSEKDRVLY
jgi:hypothetical protein